VHSVSSSVGLLLKEDTSPIDKSHGSIRSTMVITENHKFLSVPCPSALVVTIEISVQNCDFQNSHIKNDDHLPPCPCDNLGSMYKVLQHNTFKCKHCSVHFIEHDRLKTIPGSYVDGIEEILTRSYW
jgi:hypothetical protein